VCVCVYKRKLERKNLCVCVCVCVCVWERRRELVCVRVCMKMRVCACACIRIGIGWMFYCCCLSLSFAWYPLAGYLGMFIPSARQPSPPTLQQHRALVYKCPSVLQTHTPVSFLRLLRTNACMRSNTTHAFTQMHKRRYYTLHRDERPAQPKMPSCGNVRQRPSTHSVAESHVTEVRSRASSASAYSSNRSRKDSLASRRVSMGIRNRENSATSFRSRSSFTNVGSGTRLYTLVI